MSVRILGIQPKPTFNSTEDTVRAHLQIDRFLWENDQTGNRGTSSRQKMFEWIVNNHGRAFVVPKDDSNTKVWVYGAQHAGQMYVRTLRDGKWTNDLLELSSFDS